MRTHGGMNRRAFCGLAATVGIAVGIATAGFAFQGGSGTPASSEVIIKREALKLTDPQHYKVALYLEPVRQVDLTAPVAGLVQSVSARLGQREAKGAEAFRLENAQAGLILRKVRGNLQAAKVEKRIADGKKDADLIALADARVDAAQADVELAELESQRLVIRMPFAAQVVKIHAPEGQTVRPGDLLATIAETSKLVVEVPCEKQQANIGGTIEINIDQTPVKARIEAVLPLNPRFDVLRDLGDSLVSVVVAIDNLDVRYQARQSVYTTLQPLDPIVAVATSTVSNSSDGSRKVQVLRDNIVRNIPVRVHAKMGTERVYVSGKFRDGDELIVQASKELTDGTPVRALNASAGRTEADKAGGKGPIRLGPNPPPAGQKSGGF